MSYTVLLKSTLCKVNYDIRVVLKIIEIGGTTHCPRMCNVIFQSLQFFNNFNLLIMDE